MRTEVTWQGGMRFGAGDRWVMDASPEHGGSGAGPTPMETVLIALAGCTGMDVITILQKMRAPLAGLRIEVEAERADDHPRVFTAIHLRYHLSGEGLKPEQVVRAVALSQERYCSVSAMLRASARVSYQVFLNGSPPCAIRGGWVGWFSREYPELGYGQAMPPGSTAVATRTPPRIS